MFERLTFISKLEKVIFYYFVPLLFSSMSIFVSVDLLHLLELIVYRIPRLPFEIFACTFLFFPDNLSASSFIRNRIPATFYCEHQFWDEIEKHTFFSYP